MSEVDTHFVNRVLAVHQQLWGTQDHSFRKRGSRYYRHGQEGGPFLTDVFPGMENHVALPSGRIIDIALSPQKDKCAVIGDMPAFEGPRRQNFVCFDATGQLIWMAALPAPGSDPDAYIGIVQADSELWASSASGVNVQLDWRSGSILDRELVK